MSTGTVNVRERAEVVFENRSASAISRKTLTVAITVKVIRCAINRVICTTVPRTRRTSVCNNAPSSTTRVSVLNGCRITDVSIMLNRGVRANVEIIYRDDFFE